MTSLNLELSAKYVYEIYIYFCCAGDMNCKRKGFVEDNVSGRRR